MSKAKKTPKRVVKTVKTTGDKVQKRASSSAARARTSGIKDSMPLIFNKQNYILMGVGVGLIALGLALMVGGGSDLGEPFKPEEIYSFRRITLAPFIIIVGLLIEVYAIFKK